MNDNSREIDPRPEFLLRLRDLAEAAVPPAGGDQSQATINFEENAIDSDAPLPSIPGYEIYARIGSGGQSIVYQARHIGLGRTVALKVLQGNYLTPTAQGRLRFEATTLANLSTPNIIQIFDIGSHNGIPYLVLEFAEGGSLSKKIWRKKQTPRASAELIETLAHAMELAHRQGVVHRDLKPGNVLLQPYSVDGTIKLRTESEQLFGIPKIADFGLAHELPTGREAISSQILGTPSYMAPEQINGRADARTDVYSLGAILFEMQAGRPPFQGATPLDTLEQVRTTKPELPADSRRDTPRDLDTIIGKCLEKHPDDRYPSALSLAEDLRRFLNHEPIQAKRPTLINHAWKFVLRHPALTTAVSITFVILSTMLGLVYWQYRSAQRAELLRQHADANRFVEAARTEMQLGQWAKSIELLNHSLDLGGDDPLAIRVLRARAASALGDPKVRSDLESLIPLASERPELMAQVQMMLGDELLGIDDAQAMQWLRTALASDQLDEADRAYVHGLLSENGVDAAKHFDAAVRLQPSRLRANLMLGFTLFALGRVDEIRDVITRTQAFYPDDPQLLILQALVDAIKGRAYRVNELLERVARTLPAREVQWFRLVTTLLALVADRDILLLAAVNPQMGNWFKAKIVHSLVSVAAIKSPDSDERKEIRFAYPPLQRKAFAWAVENLEGTTIGFASVVKFLNDNKNGNLWPKYVSKLAEIVRLYPEGTLFLLLAKGLLESGRTAEAEAAFQSALTAPMLVGFKPFAHVYLLNIWYVRWNDCSDAEKRLLRPKIEASVQALSHSDLPRWMRDSESVALGYLMLERYEDLLTTVEGRLNVDPADGEARGLRAKLLYNLGRWSEAHRRLLELRLEADPKNIEWIQLIECLIDDCRFQMRRLDECASSPNSLKP